MTDDAQKPPSSDVTYGDKIDVGNMSDVQGVAIGTNASVTVIHNEIAAIPEKPKLEQEPDMVQIPESPFLMGSKSKDDVPEYETPQFEVTLPAYHIGKYPITNTQYAQFILETKQVVSNTLLWQGNKPEDGTLDHPVSGVTWYEALAYCQWLSELSGRHYTLPSEAQWERAARGVDGRIYPWGNEWEENRCNNNPDQITAVTAYPAQNEAELFDMVGNVREWTTTIWGIVTRIPSKRFPYPWQDDERNYIEEPSTTRRIYRGGRKKEVHDSRCAKRGGFLPKKPGPKRNRHGFRVVVLPVN